MSDSDHIKHLFEARSRGLQELIRWFVADSGKSVQFWTKAIEDAFGSDIHLLEKAITNLNPVQLETSVTGGDDGDDYPIIKFLSPDLQDKWWKFIESVF